jgi:acyl-CoA synthetase (AMP-forming)/AMP-acid ligase II
MRKRKTMSSFYMQATPLLISSILKFGAKAHAQREIVSRLIDEPIWRYDYAGLERRCRRLANALSALGIGSGDCVSSLAWNTHRHLELLYAVPGIGTLLHTANPRLHDEQIAFTINNAGSTVLFFDHNLLAQVERLVPLIPGIKTFVMLSSTERHLPGSVNALCYETLLSSAATHYEWPQFDEQASAVLCYTSGTTGNPKGVCYSHRAIVLHAMASGLSGAFSLSAFDVVMPCSSLYHATAWGLPYAVPINGCKFVLPADKMDGASLAELIDGEGVTLTGGVPTIWTMYLQWLEANGRPVKNLRKIIIGGSAMPRWMAETFERSGVQMLQIWGMTETTPLGTASTPTPSLVAKGEEVVRETLWSRAGRTQFGIEVRIVDESGQELPWDDTAAGFLQVRGPWTVQRYFNADNDAIDRDGWFDSGDIATINADGYLRITDRKKDVIKSGGEWISSIDLENIAIGCPGIRLAGVIGVPHPKWEERPVLIVECIPGSVLTREEVLSYMEPRVAKWWLPEDVVFDSVPLTSTGKVDKKVLRERYKGLRIG